MYLQAAGSINGPDELLTCNLLELEDDRWDWMNWSIWVNEKFERPPPAKRMLRATSYPLVIEAACQGFGLALGWGGLVDELLQTGKLVSPMDYVFETDNGYNVLRNQHSPIPSIRDQLVTAVLQRQ